MVLTAEERKERLLASQRKWNEIKKKYNKHYLKEWYKNNIERYLETTECGAPHGS